MRLLSGLLWFLYKIILFYTVLVYVVTYGLFTSHWLAGFLMLSLPVVLLAHGLFAGIWAMLSPKKILFPLLMLLLGFPFIQRTFQWNTPDEALATEKLKVMSYNVLRFNISDYQRGKENASIEQVRQWLRQQDADVICFQEFYHYKNTPELDFSSLLRKAGYRYRASQTLSHTNSDLYELGVAVYSRYPIVARQDTFLGGQNGMLQTDILWNRDTVRVIDVHLYSMTLKLNKLAQQDQYTGVKRETKGTLKQMRRGFVERAQEVALLAKWVNDTPASRPVIVCGDFNETPYSYVYGRMSKLLTNAFEEKGRGFGFTFNQLPYFIRIDHQFYTPERLVLHDFRVLNEVRHSDHYPIVGTYSLR